MLPDTISRLITDDVRTNNGLILEYKSSIPTRKLGKTGIDVPIFSLGGQGVFEKTWNASVAKNKAEFEKHNIEIIQRAYELGVRYFDTSPVYKDSEIYYGKALEGIRKKIFLATKTDIRDKDGSLKLIEKSLKRLKTDYIDLWQLHHLETIEEINEICGKDGALQALIEMKEQKVVRHLGFTGHENPKILIEMSNRFDDFDTVLCPVNAADVHVEPSFIKEMLPVAKKKNLGVIGMKVFGQGYIFSPKGIKSTWEALSYALSQDVTTVIVGCEDIGQLEENIAIAKAFKQLSKKELSEIEEKTKSYPRRACFFRSKYGGYGSKDELEPPYVI